MRLADDYGRIELVGALRALAHDIEANRANARSWWLQLRRLELDAETIMQYEEEER